MPASTASRRLPSLGGLQALRDFFGLFEVLVG
jgi:hypothetical protein